MNRLWGYLTGAGIIEPLDDIRAGNPPSNPALLEYLTHEFVDSGFNARHMMQLICKSRTYQLSIRPNKWNEDDKVNYSHAMARRLAGRDAFRRRVSGHRQHAANSRAPNPANAPPNWRMPPRTSAAVCWPPGRPARQSACECERSSDIRLGSVMALLSGPTISSAINEPTNALAKLVETEKDDRKLVNEVFLRVLNRPATESEITNALALLSEWMTTTRNITNELGATRGENGPRHRRHKKTARRGHHQSQSRSGHLR